MVQHLLSQSTMPVITTESSGKVIGCAIKVHKALGPGLFESVYEPCLAHEMANAGVRFQRQVILPITYGEVLVKRAFRLDLVVESDLIVEIKSIEGFSPLHTKQLVTYMKLSGIRKGLLINFNVTLLKHGLKSVVL